MHGDVVRDDEGLQTMRTLGHNLARLIKALKKRAAPTTRESRMDILPRVSDAMSSHDPEIEELQYYAKD